MYAIRSYYAFASYGDAAIIMIGRPGGEGGDLAQDMLDIPNSENIDPRALIEVVCQPVPVITSYSIHYTKLYEPLAQWETARRR